MSIIKVKTGGITADAITDALIADDVVGTEHLTANEVDTTALGADAVTGAQLADNAVNSEHYTDGSVDTAHIADAQITTAKLSTAVFTGATDIGAAIADADLFLIDDGAGGTIRKTTASRLKTYATGKVLQYKKVQSGAWDAASGNWNITSSTLTNTGQTVSITPVAADSTIVGNGFITYGADVSSTTHFQFGFSLRRDDASPGNDDTEVTGGTPNTSFLDSEFNSSQQTRYDVYRITPIHLYDTSFDTTNEVTYRLYAKSTGVSGQGHQNRGGMLFLHLWEIGA